MRFVLTTLMVFIIISEAIAGEWVKISQFPGYTRIHYMDAIDSLRFVISGETSIGKYPDFEQYSFVAITKNGGYDWEYIFKDYMVLPDKNNIGIQGVEWVNDSSIFAGLDGGLIIHTNNYGKTWDTVFSSNGTTELRNTILNFDDSGRYGVCSFAGLPYFLISDDGGLTWEQIPDPDPTINIPAIKRIGKNRILVHYFIQTKTNSWIAHTEDRGKTWNFFKESDNYMTGFFFYDDSLGFMGGVVDPKNHDTRSIIKRTRDSGINWETVWISEKDHHQSVNQIEFHNKTNPSFIFALSNGFIYKSLDTGNTWVTSFDYSQDTFELATNDRIECYDGNCLFANSEGLILKYVGPNTKVSDDVKFNYIAKAYPNPISQGQTLNIEIEMESNGNVTIDLINILGIKVAEVYNGYLSAGKRTIFKTFKEDLPLGTYYLRMTVNGKKQIVKTVVLE